MNFDDNNILNIYKFGSVVYGTNNKESDQDYIVVTSDKVISDDINIQSYTVIEFQRLIDEHDITVLECLFLSESNILRGKTEFSFELDIAKLRVSISTVANGAWIKGKKKLTIMSDYNKKIALKSLFHSIRIRDLGIQIATHGKIIDYGKYNWLLTDLYKLGGEYDYNELWYKIDDKYRSLSNKLSSDFKMLTPKNLLPSNIIYDKLIDLFVKNGCYDKTIMDKRFIKKIIEIVNE